MKIDGRRLANEILNNLKPQLKRLKARGIVPHLGVILVGNDKASLNYIQQKQKAAQKIGALVTVSHLAKTPLYQKLAEMILTIDKNPDIHGIIVQRPLPPSLSANILNKRISLIKDVDGFLPKTTFIPPVGLAVFKILNEIFYRGLQNSRKPDEDFSPQLLSWLKRKNIVLIGTGETAGQPIADTLSKLKIHFINVNSRSDNPGEYYKQADIIISCVGKSGLFTGADLKPNVILIGVGMHKEKGKWVGDYDEKEIHKIASFYTPTPHGTGPVNVACLIENLVIACNKQSSL